MDDASLEALLFGIPRAHMASEWLAQSTVVVVTVEVPLEVALAGLVDSGGWVGTLMLTRPPGVSCI